MDKAVVLAVATTIREQLFGLTNKNILWSWGLQGLCATLYKDMAALKFQVNGRLFQGYVLICYNTLDQYEIYLSNQDGTRCICDMAYFDTMGEIIDTAIESGTDKAEYKQFCLAEEAKLFSGQF